MEVEKFPVLVVEDSEDDVFILRRAFKESQLANPLHVVEDGQQAIDYLSGMGEFANRDEFPMPFLVLLDLKLPLKDGLEILEWIQKQPFAEDLHVVVLTSSAEERDVTKAYHLGARSYLTKPPSPKTLREMMTTLNGSFLTRQSLKRLNLSEDLFGQIRE